MENIESKKTVKPCFLRQFLFFLAILLSLLAVGLGLFTWYNVRYISTELSYAQAEKERVQNSLSSLNQKLSNLQNKFDQLTENKKTTLVYLIRLANLELIVYRDVNTALVLMKEAQQALNLMDNKNMDLLKAAVKTNISALENASQFDINILLTRLNGVSTKVENLTAIPSMTSSLPEPSKNANSTSSWHERWNEILNRLKKLVVIHHEQKTIKPLLSANELVFLKQNVRFKITEAEWAVLHQNQEMYQQSLLLAKALLDKYYPDSKDGNDIKQELQSLSEINIKPELPNLLNTLKILQQNPLEDKA